MSEKQDRCNSREMQDGQDKFSGAMRIFESLSAVDEELLERSEGTDFSRIKGQSKRKIVPLWRYSRAIAACCCMVVLGTAVYAGVRFVSGPYGNKAAEMELADEMAAYDVAEEKLQEAEERAPEAVENQSALTEEEAKFEEREALADQKKEAEMAPGKGETTGVNTMQNGMAGKEQTDGIDAGNQQEAETKLEDAEIEVCEKAPYEPIEEEEARAIEKFGEFIPTALPSGFRFESAYLLEEDGMTKGVCLCWTRGMDDINITVRDISSELKSDSGENTYPITDISRPETYDIHLYEIPYGETVLQEYWQIFDHPIFKEEDFTMDIVKARMKSIEDQGDTDTPRGMFGVLYEDGVLVEFNGRGSVEEVWNLFKSIE